MKITLYKDPDGNIHTVSDESPKGFKNVLFVGHGPDGKEQVYAANVLQKWEQVDAPKPGPDPATIFEKVKLEFSPWQNIPSENIPRSKTKFGAKEFMYWILFVVVFLAYQMYLKPWVLT